MSWPSVAPCGAGAASAELAGAPTSVDQYLPKKRDQDAEGVETAPVVIVPSRSKAGLFLALGLGFVACGALLMGHPDPVGRFFGALGLLFGLVGAGAALGLRRSASTHLAMDEGGLTHRHLWRDTHVAWGDIRKIGVFHQGGQRMVVYDLAEDHPAGHGWLARMNRHFCGYSHAIPDTYGSAPEELAELLEAWRVAYSPPALPADADPGEA